MQLQANALFTLHTSHTSSQLFSSRPISSHMESKQILLNCFHLIRALINLSHLLKVLLNSSQLFCTPESPYCQTEVSCRKKHWAQKAFAHRSLRHRCIYTEKPLQNTLYYKACTKHFSHYYSVLQSLHKALPCTTLYYKACTTQQPSTTFYHKACTKFFLALLCTTKLAQSTSQYHFVLQSLHKALPSTTLYCKASTKASFFNTEKQKVSCSGFLPKTNPMQHSRSHYNAFCSSKYAFMQPLHCDLHPRVAEHQGRTNHTSKWTVRNRRTDEVPFIAACLQPLYTEKHKVSCSCFLPQTNPMQHSRSHYNAFCSNTYTFMQPLLSHHTTSQSHQHFP